MTEKDIRRIMLSGEEKVPSRVWSAIRDRLDTICAAPATNDGWWKLGIALCSLAAAALALLLFLGKPTENIDTQSNIELVAEAVQAPEADVPTPHAATIRAAVPLVTAPTEETSAATNEISSTETESTPAAATRATTTRATTTRAATTAPSAAKRTVREQFVPQDNRIVTLVAQGSIFGNDSDLIKGASTQYKSPSATTIISNGITETGASTYGIPFSLGVGVRISILERFSVGTGLTYSLLTRTFKGNYKQDEIYVTGADIRQTMHYMGVPVNAYYSIIDNSTLDFYVFGGGSMEFCLSNKYKISASGANYRYKDDVKGLQFSVALGMGVSFKLTDKFSIYIDPNARYYFPSSHPKSVRSDKPFMFVLEAGAKFDL